VRDRELLPIELPVMPLKWAKRARVPLYHQTMSQKSSSFGLFLTLDGFGTLLLVVGVLGLTGTDFGQPVLTTLAPFLITAGIILMLPLIVWIVKKSVIRN
jgi:hypothetical protein